VAEVVQSPSFEHLGPLADVPPQLRNASAEEAVPAGVEQMIISGLVDPPAGKDRRRGVHSFTWDCSLLLDALTIAGLQMLLQTRRSDSSLRCLLSGAPHAFWGVGTPVGTLAVVACIPVRVQLPVRGATAGNHS